MNYANKQRLTRHKDWSDSAVAWRLRAAETVSGQTQKQIARALGKSPQTVNTQMVKGRPSIQLMTHFYLHHRIDFNFILYGDFSQLPVDVHDRLLAALAAQSQP